MIMGGGGDLKWQWERENAGPPGWYATVICWDVEEGMIPDADYWDGSAWREGYPVMACAGPFETENDADDWAQSHDPEVVPGQYR
jgi:hypothetical protein